MTTSAEHRWALVWEHRDRLLVIARARCASPEDAEDVVAEAMLRAVEYDRLDEDRVGAFLCSVVLRLAVDSHRSRARYLRAGARVAAAPDPAAVDEAVCEREEARWLAAALRDVRGRERQLLEARAEGRTVAEAAVHLGISAKAAENAWTRVRGKAAKLLAATLAAFGGMSLRRAAPAAPAALALAGAVWLAASAPAVPVRPAPEPRTAPAAASPTAAEAVAATPRASVTAVASPAVLGSRPPARRTPLVTPPRAPVVTVPGVTVASGAAELGETRVRREHDEETFEESLRRCLGNVSLGEPLRDPCDY
jgi:RNA polymerase sigma-70 factor (ECF subfamily)